MKLGATQLQELAKTAQFAARRAAELIQQFQGAELAIKRKEGQLSKAAAVVTQVDLECQQVILETLQEAIKHYDLGVLTEELQDERSRLEKDYFWCIDPLDGTLPFTEQRPGYAVSIALVSREGLLVLGVIHDPVTERSCTAIKGLGVTWTPSGSDMEDATRQDLVCYLDRSFKEANSFAAVQAQLQQIVQDLGLNKLVIRTGAGAVMNALGVVRHANAVYFKFPKKTKGGGSLWDYAATACLFSELNLPVSDIYGRTLDLNNERTTFMNGSGVLYASHEALAQKFIEMYQDLNR